MSRSPHRGRNDSARGALAHEQTGGVSRRSILAGTAATTAIATAGPIGGAAYASSANPNSKRDMMAFLLLSAALTGIKVVNLAPGFVQDKTKPDLLDSNPGTDPFNVKNDYFNWLNTGYAPGFERLLQIARDHSQSAPDIINAVNASDETKYLGRSIVLMWYLGSWYKPADLQNAEKNSKSGGPIPSTVISAKAYTLGLVWQIALAHPMGYSNLQFGYWSREPVDPNDTNSPTSFITPTLP
jgi:hypothetical protein